MSHPDHLPIDSDEWDGVYYDAEGGEFVTVEVSGMNLLLKCEEDGALYHTVGSAEEWEDIRDDLMAVPEDAVENPLRVGERIYNKGFERLMEHDMFDSDIAVMYADRKVTVVEKE